MLAPVVTRRYAEALFAAAVDARKTAEVEADLEVVRAAVSEPEVAALLRNAAADAAELRTRVLAPLQGRLATDLVRNTIALLIDRSRAAVLLGLADSLHRLALEARGEAEGIVESARALQPDELRSVEERLGRATGRKVSLQARLEPSLIGGLRATVGSLRYDASVQTRLTDLRSRMLAARLESGGAR